MPAGSIEFRFETAESEARFLREYLAEVWHRFETSDFWSMGWYWAYRQYAAYDVGVDGGYVQLVFEGEPDRLVDAESAEWERFDGLTAWELTRYADEGYESLLAQQTDAKGESGGEWDYRLKPLISRFSLAYLQEFDDSLPAVGEVTDDNPAGIGFWTVIHYAMAQCGYDWYDEIAACRKATQNRLRSLAHFRGAEAAEAEYERILAEWRRQGDELERWLTENQTGEATVD